MKKALINSLNVADSVEFMQKNMPNDGIDLTVTSPTYDSLRNYQR